MKHPFAQYEPIKFDEKFETKIHHAHKVDMIIILGIISTLFLVASLGFVYILIPRI